MGIKIIDPKVFKALLEVTYHPKMIELALWYAWSFNTPIITSAYRKNKVWDGDSGIHMTNPCRAIDWSCEGLTDCHKVTEEINNHWIYDPDRPEKKCAMCHNVGLGLHIHTQVHDKTIQVNK